MVILTVMATLFLERWRGRRALVEWKTDMIARGEIFDAKRLWPPASSLGIEFSNQLARVVQELSPRLSRYAGQLSGIVMDGACQSRRGSQEPRPPLIQSTDVTRTWDELRACVREAQPALQSLRQLVQNSPPFMGYDIVAVLANASLPNYVDVRCGAQALHAAAISELHQANLAGALEDLEALLAFERLSSHDPTLVNLMIRVAIMGLSVDVLWDALQAPGWTEVQLVRLQQACEGHVLLPQMSRAAEAERAARLYDLGWLRSHSYEDWISRYQPIYQAFGWSPPVWQTTPLVRAWRQWLFHPVWRFAWADQEEMTYLKHAQVELTTLRQATNHQSWLQLNRQLAADDQNYHPSRANWRFYTRLPFIDDVSGIVGSRPGAAEPVNPYPNYSRAWLAIFKTLTLREMVITTVAIERYRLGHGRVPPDLAALVPAFLASAPHDFLDGKRLRYRWNADNCFTLYSVGEDGVDSGGNPHPSATTQDRDGTSPWSGRDWVWPIGRDGR